MKQIQEDNSRKDKAFFGFQDDQDEDSDQEMDEIVNQTEEDLEQRKRSSKQNENFSYQSNLADQKTNVPQPSLQQQFSAQTPKASKVKETIKTKDIVNLTYNVVLIVALELVSNIFFTYPIIIFRGVFEVFKYMIIPCNGSFKENFLNPLVQIIFAGSVLNVCYETVLGFIRERDIYSIWYFDAFFLFFTKILIFTIIKLSKQNDFTLSWSNVCSIFDYGSQNGLVLDLSDKYNEKQVIMDIPSKEEKWQQEYLHIIHNKLEVDLQAQRFNTLQNHMRNPLSLELIGFQFFKGQNQELRSHMGQFIVAQALSFAKILCCFGFIYYHFMFGQQDIINLVTITLFNINEIYCLNILLSNQDLRRKALISTKLNEPIEFTGDENMDYKQQLDVTSCVSLETWDNSRRSLYMFFEDMYRRLEYSYFCIFIYYIFVLNICIASYFDIYFIFDKDSVFLNPLIVISSSFNFLILNAFLLFRFYFGTKYNETIDEAGERIDTLIGIYQDLLQMYDFNFQQKEISEGVFKLVQNNPDYVYQAYQPTRQMEEFQYQDDKKLMSSQLVDQSYNNISSYDLIIAKTKLLSRFYIDRRIEFQGKVFTFTEEKILQQKMLKNIIKSLQRIKSQIEIDSKQLSYKALNVLQLDFQETLLTITIGLITILPDIVPKILELFQNSAIEI